MDDRLQKLANEIVEDCQVNEFLTNLERILSRGEIGKETRNIVLERKLNKADLKIYLMVCSIYGDSLRRINMARNIVFGEDRKKVKYDYITFEANPPRVLYIKNDD